MPLKRSLLIALCLTLSGAALAHQSVKNPAVKARMDGMVKINAAMKSLSQIAKTERPYHQSQVKQSLLVIVRESRQVPKLFRDPQQDPASEAVPALWQNFDDFTQKAKDMELAAQKAIESSKDVATLRSAFRDIGVTCKACHRLYTK